MDKSKVVSILAPYSPPLAPSQVEAIATKIFSEMEKLAEVLKADFEAKLKEVTEAEPTEEAEPKETEAEAPKAPEAPKAAPTKKTSKSKS